MIREAAGTMGAKPDGGCVFLGAVGRRGKGVGTTRGHGRHETRISGAAAGVTRPVPFLAPSRADAHTPLMQTAVTLTLNGEARAFDGPMTIAGLLASLGLETRKVAVERNAEIVPRSIYAETWLQSGDALEIVHFIGGG
jgi:sulfur carrier protein